MQVSDTTESIVQNCNLISDCRFTEGSGGGTDASIIYGTEASEADAKAMEIDGSVDTTERISVSWSKTV